MKSTMATMTASLCGLSLIIGAALAGVDSLTREPIAKARENMRNEAIAEVLPDFDNAPSAQAIYTEDGQTIFPAFLSGRNVGAAVETYSDNGFSGRFTVLVGLDTLGCVTGYKVLSHTETPGLGERMCTWFSEAGTTHDIRGKNAPFGVRADGGDIDAITGATISSRAFLEAVNRAVETVANHIDELNEISQ